VQRVADGVPHALGRRHIEGEDVVRQAAGVRQRHRARGLRQALEAQMPVAADQRAAACADDHLLHLQRQAHQIARLHQRALDELVVGAGGHGQARDLGQMAAAQRLGQPVAAFQQQWPLPVGRDAHGADRRRVAAVAHDQHHGMGHPVGGIGPPHDARHLGNVVPVGEGAHLADVGQIGLRARDAEIERQLLDGHCA